MISIFSKISSLLSRKEKGRAAVVIFMMIVLAVTEVAGIASVAPFLAVLGNTDTIYESKSLSLLYEYFGFTDPNSFLMMLGIFAILIFSGASVFRIITHYAIFHFSNMRRHSVSRRLLASHLKQEYEFFLDRNTSDLSKTILSEVDQLSNHVIKPFCEIIAYGLAAFSIIIFLILIDPRLAASVGIIVGGIYVVFYASIRGILGRIGAERVESNRDRFKVAAEALGSIKELKVLGREDTFFRKFDPASERFARHHATNQVLGQVPRYVVEAVGFAIVVVISMFVLVGKENVGDALPVIGLYALAGYRLLPAVQHVYGAMTRLRFGVSALDTILEELKASSSNISKKSVHKEQKRLALDDSFRMIDVSYTYPGSNKPALSQVNLCISAHSAVGIVGKTGAGKSTLVDLILGLLHPKHGKIVIDGKPLDLEGLRGWQNNIGYVPQSIFLTDESVRNNIALGIEDADINEESVIRAAKAAQIHDFITGDLKNGYSTTVGERGVRLSGGQRQRIGIARALYHDPDILILDEATSALDSRTEEEILSTLTSIKGRKTIVMIAHRLQTLEICESIIRIDEGRVIEVGDYQDVISVSK